MPIQNPQPIVKPESEQEVFDSFWIKSLIINSPNPDQKSSVVIQLKPYNPTNGKTLEAPLKNLIIKDLWGASNEKPEIAQAISALISAVNVVVND